MPKQTKRSTQSEWDAAAVAMAMATMVVVALIWLLYERHKIAINAFGLGVIRIETWFYAGFPQWIPGAWHTASSHVAPARVTGWGLTKGLAAGGRWFAVPVLLVLFVPALIVLRIKFGRLQRFERVFDLRSIALLQAQRYPFSLPALRKDLWNQPYDSGPWAVAQTPLRFVVDHKLLLDAKGVAVASELLLDRYGNPNLHSPLLRRSGSAPDARYPTEGFRVDRDAARAVFVRQLGPRFQGVRALPNYQQSLAAALLAFAHGERNVAMDLLERISRSFVEAETTRSGTRTPMRYDGTGTRELLETYADTQETRYALVGHAAWTHPWFVELLEYARRRGRMLSAWFIWLRPTDRTLWTVLNQTGGRSCFAEGAGAFVHHEAESVLGEMLLVPEVEAAVDSLVGYLIETAWLPPPSSDEGNDDPALADFIHKYHDDGHAA